MSVFGVFLVRILPHSELIRRDTLYLSVFNPNTWKYGPEKLEIRTLFTKWTVSLHLYPYAKSSIDDSSAIQQSKLKIYIASVIFRALDGNLWTMLHKITFAYLSVTFGNFLKLYIWVFVKFLTSFREHLFKGAPLNGCL